MAFEALESYPVLVESRNRVLRLFESGRSVDRRRRRGGRGRPRADGHRRATGQPARRPDARPDRQRRRGRRGAVDRHRPRDRQPRPDVRLLRAHRRLAGDPRALPPARDRHPARRRPARARDRLRAPRPADGHLAAARHRQAGARPRLPGVPRAGPRRRHARPRSGSSAERRELGVDHALVGGVLARRWALPAVDRQRDRAPSRRGRRPTRPRSSGWPTCSPTTCSAARSPRRRCWPRLGRSSSARRACGR